MTKVVLIDATIVRGVLLPATMKVLGDWNWYLPKWLEWVPQVGTEADTALPLEPDAAEVGEQPEPAGVPA